MDKLKFIAVFAVLAAAVCPLGAQSDAGPEEVDEQTEQTDDVITQPEYPGGTEKLYEFIIDNFEFPTECKKRNVRGTVEIEFTIEKGGDMSALCIIKGLDPEIDKELIRVFKAMPLWTPATKNGKPARYTLVMPVTLKLSRTDKNGFR